jgi:hypothetical protein
MDLVRERSQISLPDLRVVNPFCFDPIMHRKSPGNIIIGQVS